MSKIVCNSQEEFFDTVAAMVQRGIVFNAFIGSMTIVLTGGH